jgi:hypothetical protein
VESDIQNLTKYFSRPIALTNGDLPLGSTTRFYAKGYDFTSEIVNQFPNGLDRLTGVYGVRASLVFTLQLAATPFHQGVIALAWQYGNLAGTRQGYDRGARSETVTNLPHVRLDLSEQTMVILRVPYIAPYDFITVRGEYINWLYGELSLTGILPPVTTPGATSPTYKVYAHIEDLELFGVYPAATQAINLQMGDVEKEKKQVASKVLTVAASAARMFRGVPMISSYSEPLAWFLDAMAGTARSFGFSKPTVADIPAKRVDWGCV